MLKTTFHNVTVTIAADPERAYDLLCKALESIEVSAEYVSDSFTTSDAPDNDRCTSELWPEEPTC
jgi:hypothetical protein